MSLSRRRAHLAAWSLQRYLSSSALTAKPLSVGSGFENSVYSLLPFVSSLANFSMSPPYSFSLLLRFSRSFSAIFSFSDPGATLVFSSLLQAPSQQKYNEDQGQLKAHLISFTLSHKPSSSPNFSYFFLLSTDASISPWSS